MPKLICGNCAQFTGSCACRAGQAWLKAKLNILDAVLGDLACVSQVNLDSLEGSRSRVRAAALKLTNMVKEMDS